MKYNITRIVNSLFKSCTYIIEVDKDVWTVDCGDIKPLIKILNGRHLCGVMLTHAHFDHIYGLNDLMSYFPETIIYTNVNGRNTLLDDKKNLSRYHDMPFVYKYPSNIQVVSDCDILYNNGHPLVQVFETPGHHPSCLTYLVEDVVFTGDAFIPGTKVVTNLPEGNKIQAFISLERIKSITSGKIVYPGHHI